MTPVHLFLIIFLLTGPPAYETLKTPYFDFFFTPGDRAAVEVLARDSSAIADGVMSDLGVGLTRKISVYIPDRGGFQKAQPAHAPMPDTVIGTAYDHLSLMVLKSPRAIRSSRVQLEKTFIHELTHILLGQAFSGHAPVPRWLNEGIALYLAREWEIDRVFAMTHAVLTGSLIPLVELTHAFPEDREKRERAYCQSFYLIAFLISQHGTEQFRNFIRLYSQEKVLEDVLITIYGMNLYELERRWHRMLKMRFSWIPLITSSLTLWFIMSVIFLWSYLRKKRNARLTVQRWEEECE